MKRKRLLLAISAFTIGICLCALFQLKDMPYIFLGNSYEGGSDMYVSIYLDENKIYDGMLYAGLPFPLSPQNMKVGFHRISVYDDNADKIMEKSFFYFFQNSIWIDFFKERGQTKLHIICAYRQIPL